MDEDDNGYYVVTLKVNSPLDEGELADWLDGLFWSVLPPKVNVEDLHVYAACR